MMNGHVTPATPFSQLYWHVPQKLLDVLNGVDWSQVDVNDVRAISAQLEEYVQLMQPPLPVGMDSRPMTVPKLKIAKHVPQMLLDHFNAINWSQVPATKIKTFALGMRGYIAMKRLPKRRT